MIYNVSQLLKEPVGSTRTFATDAYERVDNDSAQVLPDGRVHMLRTDRGILVRAKLSARLRLTCSRCLVNFHQQVPLALEEEFLPTVDVTTGQSLQIPSDAEASFTIDEHHMLDLTEVARQYCLTDQPMKPLCRSGCLGICQTCGKNKNEGTCICRSDAIDPRWGPLAGLLEGRRR